MGRLVIAVLLAVHDLTFRLFANRVEPPRVRVAVLAIAVALFALGGAQLAPSSRRSRAFARFALAVDAVATAGVLALYSFDAGQHLAPLGLFVILEGVLLAGQAGGVAAWGVVTAGTIGAAVLGDVAYGVAVRPVGIAVQGAIGLLLATVLGAMVRDLSDERSTRMAEREGQRRRFQDIVWDLDAVVWESDAATRQFYFVSPPAERIFGFPTQKWLTEPGFRSRLVHPDDRDRVNEKYREVTRLARHDQFEYRLVTAEEKVVWMVDRVTPVRGTDGKVRQLRGVMTDITQRKHAEESLRNSFGLLFANNPHPMWAYDRETLRFLAVNNAAVELYGHVREEFLKMRITDICTPEEVDRLLLDMLRNRGAFERSGEWRHRAKDGTQIDVEITSHTLEFDRRRASLVMAEDITERKRAEKQLRQAEVRYQALVEQIPAVTYVSALDLDRSTVYMSPQVQDLLGYEQSDWSANPTLWQQLIHAEDRARVMLEVAKSNETSEPFVCEYRLQTLEGRTVWVRDEAIVMQDEAGRPQFWQGVMVDITDRKAAEKEIAFLAYHDKLTGLPNRAMFAEVLDHALARARRQALSVAVLYVDLDDFKLVNDSLGHSAGDDMLRQLSGRLKEATRDMDMVSRVGGDEFLVLVADIDRDTAAAGGDRAMGDTANGALLSAEGVARRIQDSLREPFVLGGTEVYVSASIGISVFPLDAEDASALLKNADLAMYRSKKQQPGGCMIFAEEQRSSLPDLSFATRLRKAVDAEQWMLHYQPIVDLREGTTVGLEALLRWLDPEAGMIGPAEFIPLAEEMGLIGTIGDWVVGELCRQRRVWQDEGIRIDMSFNLSARQLWEPNLVDTMLVRLHDAGVEPSSVIVEITESAAMTDLDRTQPILWELHRHGLRLAIDDFGMGYSSLSRLKQLPVDILKIDRFFIRDLPHDKDARSMVEAIIRLATGLDMQPLAEGIETEAQWRFLAESGCSLGQGFFFSRPIPAVELTPLLQRGRAFTARR
jgi:diguanylate cyclase (GGDEF)-like protein/PAS domain S-box-containing protein